MNNVYQLLDKELERLHKLLEQEIVMTQSRGYSGHNNGAAAWDAIQKFHEMIMKSYQANDVALQEKIAEFALLTPPKKEDNG